MAPDSTDPNVTDGSHEQTEACSARSCTRGGPFSGGLGIFIFVVLFAGAAFLTYRTLFTAEITAAEPVPRVFMCEETGQVFGYALTEGEHWPVLSKFSGKKTAYPAEACYWTKDGKQKRKPDYVILNEYMGKPGDTFCPVCGRLVVGHNPPPPPEIPYIDEPQESSADSAASSDVAAGAAEKPVSKDAGAAEEAAPPPQPSMQ